MQLRIRETRASKVELRLATDEEKDEKGLNLQYRSIFVPDHRDCFAIEFRAQVLASDDHFLEAHYICDFAVEGGFDSDFEDSTIVRVNAPAIAFPFLRAFLAQITLLCGYESILLPSQNFKVLAEEKESGGDSGADSGVSE